MNSGSLLKHSSELILIFTDKRPEDLLLNCSKLGMKKVFHHIGVPAAEAQPIANHDLLGDFVRRYGFPLIIKHERGVGASNTYK